MIKNKYLSNEIKKEKNPRKKERDMNVEKIIDEINREYDFLYDNESSNIYYPNKENRNNNIEADEIYFNHDSVNKHLFNKKKSAEKLETTNLNKNYNDNISYSKNKNSDYHLLQNYQEDIAYEDSELIKILEKSKHEK